MTYEEQYLAKWLKDHDMLPVRTIENKANIPIHTLRLFLEERRGLPSKHYKSIIDVLFDYGFKEFNQE